MECSKLGKTRIITDASCGMVRNTGFCGQNLPPHVYLELLNTVHFMRAPSAALRQPCLGQPHARELHRRNAQNNTGAHIPDPQSIASVLEQLAGLERKGGKCCKAAADAGL